MEPSLPGGSETATAGGFDADDVVHCQVACDLCGQLFVVDEVAARRACLAPLGALGRVLSSLGDQREAAGLEDAKLADDSVPAAVAPGAAGADPELVPHDAHRVRNLEGLGRSSQCV